MLWRVSLCVSVFLPLLCSAQNIREFSLGTNQYFTGSSADHSVWLVKGRAPGGGIWTSAGYQELAMPNEAGAFEPNIISASGDWVVGSASFDVDTYQVDRPIRWNTRTGAVDVLSTDFALARPWGVTDDGQKVLVMSPNNSGSSIWNNGVVTGLLQNGVHMSRDGVTISTRRDTGSVEEFGLYVGSTYEQFPALRAFGGGVSADGLTAIAQEIATGQTVRMRRTVGSSTWTQTPLGIPLGELAGEPALVSADGSVVGSANGVWRDGAGWTSVASLVGAGYAGARITSIHTDGGGFFFEANQGRDYEYRVVPEPTGIAAVAAGFLVLFRARSRRS